MADRPVADKAVADRAAADRAMADRAVADRAVADRAVADRAVADRAVADRVAADRAVADRAVADRAAACDPNCWMTKQERCFYIRGESEKNVGRLTDCNFAFCHPIVANESFPWSQELKLDRKPFPIKIGHLMHLEEEISFVRPCMGPCKPVKSFSKTVPRLPWQKLQVRVLLSRENEMVRI